MSPAPLWRQTLTAMDDAVLSIDDIAKADQPMAAAMIDSMIRWARQEFGAYPAVCNMVVSRLERERQMALDE